MAKVVTDDSHYKAIADTIRENMAGAGMNETMKPSEMPEWINDACMVAREGAIDEGYSEGYSVGYANGEEDGIAEGIQTEYDRFWDIFQQNGNRTNYAGAFAGHGWTAETLKPKYDVVLTSIGSQLFYYSGFAGDLAKHFEDLGIRFDTSKMTAAHSFANSAQTITRFPEINITLCGAANSSMFSYCGSLVTIDKLVVAANNAWASAFVNCFALENLTIEGTIGVSGLNVQWSTKLSKASINSVVNALSSTTSGLSVTFSAAAVNSAFETSTGAADGSNSDEWAELAATKSNWNINLV